MENFNPSDPDKSNFNGNTDELLQFLFKTFPVDCISDFQLNEILTDLGYKRFSYIVENTTESFEGKDDNRKSIFTIYKTLAHGWCLKSVLNLEPEIVAK